MGHDLTFTEYQEDLVNSVKEYLQVGRGETQFKTRILTRQNVLHVSERLFSAALRQETKGITMTAYSGCETVSCARVFVSSIGYQKYEDLCLL